MFQARKHFSVWDNFPFFCFIFSLLWWTLLRQQANWCLGRGCGRNASEKTPPPRPISSVVMSYGKPSNGFLLLHWRQTGRMLLLPPYLPRRPTNDEWDNIFKPWLMLFIRPTGMSSSYGLFSFILSTKKSLLKSKISMQHFTAITRVICGWILFV